MTRTHPGNDSADVRTLTVYLVLVSCFAFPVLAFTPQFDLTVGSAKAQTAGLSDKVVSLPAGWVRFSPPGSSFTIFLPAQPVKEVSKSMISKSVAITTDAYTAVNNDGVFVVAHVKDFPIDTAGIMDELKQKFYAEMWKGITEGIRVQLEKNGTNYTVVPVGQPRTCSVGGYEGREQDFSIGPLSGRAQMVLPGRQAFTLLSVLANQDAIPKRDTFFSSFQIIPSKRRP